VGFRALRRVQSVGFRALRRVQGLGFRAYRSDSVPSFVLRVFGIERGRECDPDRGLDTGLDRRI
jgi:hypothetical protein